MRRRAGKSSGQWRSKEDDSKSSTRNSSSTTRNRLREGMVKRTALDQVMGPVPVMVLGMVPVLGMVLVLGMAQVLDNTTSSNRCMLSNNRHPVVVDSEVVEWHYPCWVAWQV